MKLSYIFFIVDEGTFYATFDKLADSNIVLSELGIEQGLAEWRDKSSSPRKYLVGCIEETSLMFADFTEIDSKELNKPLLDDLCKIAEITKSETMYVALSAANPEMGHIVRNLLVYGFEKTTKIEAKNYASDSNILLMKMEVNQEDDFVDLY